MILRTGQDWTDHLWNYARTQLIILETGKGKESSISTALDNQIMEILSLQRMIANKYKRNSNKISTFRPLMK